MTITTETYRAALIGLQLKHAELNTRIAEIRQELNGRLAAEIAAGPAVPLPRPARRKMSPAGRRAIGRAQRARWKAWRERRVQP